MTPEEIKRHRRLNFRQTNAFAMQYGAIMGLYVFAAEACFVLGLKIGGLMTLQTLLTLAYPAVIIWLAFRFRNQVSEGLPYSFGRGFLLYVARCALFRNMGVVGRIALLAIFRRRLLVPNIS